MKLRNKQIVFIFAELLGFKHYFVGYSNFYNQAISFDCDCVSVFNCILFDNIRSFLRILPFNPFCQTFYTFQRFH